MRRIGTLNSEKEARAFSDYLFTLKLDTQVSGHDSAWDVWLLDEDRLDEGRRELELFRTTPHDPKYTSAASAARAQRDAELQAVLSAAKQHIDLRERWERPLWLQMPVTFVLLAACVIVTLLCEFGNNHDLMSKLQVQSSTIQGNNIQWRSGLSDIGSGQIWRLFTPILLHMSPWHLIPNVMLGLTLCGMIERERGSWRLLLGVLAIAAISNVAQYLVHGPQFGGLSGVVYGLFGYVWVMGKWEPQAGLQFSRESTVLMVVWLFLCTTGAVGPIANVCHFTGLAVGLAWAALEILWRRARA
jgi:GlpG protein